MKYYKSIFAIAALFFFVGGISAQEEAGKTKKNKDKVSNEKADELMNSKAAELQEPAYFSSIEQGAKANSAGIHNAYTLELLNADKKIVDKAWRNLMKTYQGKSKYNRKEAEVGTINARIPELGSAEYTVKASIEERGENVVLHSWFEGEDGYIDTNAESENDGVQRLLESFAVEVRKEMVKIEINKEEKELKSSENELSKLKRQHDSYLRDIEVAKRKIAEAEQNIIENEAAQEDAIAKIDGQREIVESIRQRLKRIN